MKTARLPMDLRIAGLYILFGGIWILGTGFLMELTIHDVSVFSQLEVVKGLVFVLGSAALIYFLTRWERLQREKMERVLRRSEAAAAQSEIRLATIFRASPAPIAISRLSDQKFIAANDAFQTLTGYTLPEIIEHTPAELNFWVDPSERQRLVTLLQTTGTVQGFEFQVRQKSGRVMEMQMWAELIELDGERCMLNIAHDMTERKLMERRLRESEQRFRTALNSMLEGCQIVDFDWRYIYVNEAAARQGGRRPEELLMRTISEACPGIEKTSLFQTLQNCMGLRVPGHLETELSVGNQLRGCFEFSIQPVPEGLFILSMDITERKRAEAALRESEERYRGLFEDSPIALWEEDFSTVKRLLDELHLAGVTDFRAYLEINPQKVRECLQSIKVLDVNRATLQLQGIESKEELLQSLEGVLRADLDDGFLQELVYIAEGRLQFSWEGINYTRNGQQQDVSLNWSVAPGHEKDLSKVIVSIIDVTERKQTEIALKASEARYRGLFENSPIAMREEDFSGVKRRLDELKQEGVIDFETYLSQHPGIVAECASLARVVDVNQATLRQYGATSKGQMPRSLGDILEDAAIQHFVHQLARLAERQTHFDWEGKDKKLDGSPIHVQASWSVAPGHEDDLSKVIVSVIDITERKQAEQALRASEEKYRKLFSEMFSGCALHEMLYDDDGQPCDFVTLDANSSYERLLGLTKDQVIGKKASAVLPPDDLRQWLGFFGPVALEGYTTRYELFSTLNQKHFEGSAFCPETGKFAVTFSDITERKNSEERIQQQLKRITALRDIDRIITSSLDLRLTLNRLLAQLTEQLQLGAAAILLFDPHTFTLQYFSSRGIAEREIPDYRTPLTNELASRVAMEQKPLHVDLATGRLASGERHPLAGQNFVAYFGLPLIAKGKLCGVLEVYHHSALSHDAEWFNYLDTLAGQAAIAIDNIQMFDGLQRSNIELARAYDATIEGWSRALDMRDRETEGHTQRVTELTAALGREFGFRADELVNIRWGALLHDIGKMGIPDSILLKPGPLTEEEWAKMKQHPELAYEMLSSIQYLRNALDIPHYHHEKWDGTGYPRGLKGEQIPLAARIFAIADIWDALRSDRPYRPAWPARKALSYIRTLSGTQLDPKVVEVFLSKRIYELKTPPR